MTSPALPLGGFRPSPRADRRVGSGVGLGTFVSCLLHAGVLAPWFLASDSTPKSSPRPVLVEMMALPSPSFPSAAVAEPVAPPPDLPTLAPAAQASEPADPAPSPPPSAMELAAAAVPHPIAVPSRPLSRPHPPTVPASADRARRPVRSAAPLSAATSAVPSAAPAPTPPAATEAAPPPAPPTPAELPVLRQPAYREPPAAPIYPPQAKRLEQEGTVLLRIRIDTSGDPQDVRIFDGSGFDLLDQAALRAARQWRFQPARRDGQAIPAWVEIPVRFRLS